MLFPRRTLHPMTTDGEPPRRAPGRTPPAAGRPVPGRGPSVPVGRLLGIPLRMHWTFPLLLVFVVLVYWGSGLAVLWGLVWVAALFVGVVLHELAHCVVARHRGVRLLGILLIPLGGISQLVSMPASPDDELTVAVVGPLTSVAIGGVLAVGGVLAGARLWPPTLFAGSWWARLAWLNLALGTLNLLPALPMDGGRVLRAVLARHRSKPEATVLASRVARILAMAMIVAGFLYDFWFVLIGIFVFLGAQAEEEAVAPATARGLPGLLPRPRGSGRGWPGRGSPSRGGRRGRRRAPASPPLPGRPGDSPA